MDTKIKEVVSKILSEIAEQKELYLKTWLAKSGYDIEDGVLVIRQIKDGYGWEYFCRKKLPEDFVCPHCKQPIGE